MVSDKLGWRKGTGGGGRVEAVLDSSRILRSERVISQKVWGQGQLSGSQQKRSRPHGLEGDSRAWLPVVSAERPRPQRGGEALGHRRKGPFHPRSVSVWSFWGAMGCSGGAENPRPEGEGESGRGREWRKGRFWVRFFHPSFGKEFLSWKNLV